MSMSRTQLRLLMFCGLSAALVCALLAPAAALQNGQPWIESYVNEAEVIAAYGSAADAISAEQANALLLDLVNAERQAAGLSRLGWDALAAEVARRHAQEMAAEHYVGHYSLAGLKCEARYNALGGVDQIAENAAYNEIEYPVYVTPQLVRRMHQHWMESMSHRLNVLEPAHTQLGCAFVALKDGKLSYVAGVVEFLNDFGDYARLPERAPRGAKLHLSGALDPQRAELAWVGLGSEDLPFTRDAAYQMQHIGGYSPPDVALALLPSGLLGSYTPQTPYRRYSVDYDPLTGRFSVEIALEPHWPPLAYYVTVWARASSVQREPFCVSCQVVLVGAE